MAGRGPAPKATPLSRANDEARKRSAFEQVRADGVLRGPDLPEDIEWHPQTLRWWHTWRLSAQAQTFAPTDWDFLLDTAMLHTAYWDGDPKVASELRLRVGKFGATVEDRMRLRLEAAGPDPDNAAGQASGTAPAAAKRPTDARRRRLLKAVKDDG